MEENSSRKVYLRKESKMLMPWRRLLRTNRTFAKYVNPAHPPIYAHCVWIGWFQSIAPTSLTNIYPPQIWSTAPDYYIRHLQILSVVYLGVYWSWKTIDIISWTLELCWIVCIVLSCVSCFKKSVAQANMDKLPLLHTCILLLGSFEALKKGQVRLCIIHWSKPDVK